MCSSDLMNRKKNNEKYFVLYGAKGVGKSTIVERAAKGRKGIIMFRITTAYSRDDVMGELAKNLNIAEKGSEQGDVERWYSPDYNN